MQLQQEFKNAGGGEKEHSRKPKIRKKNQTQKQLFVSEIKLEFWLLYTSLSKNRKVFSFNYA